MISRRHLLTDAGLGVSTLESFHVPDAMGWDLQIGNKIAPSRSAGG